MSARLESRLRELLRERRCPSTGSGQAEAIGSGRTEATGSGPGGPINLFAAAAEALDGDVLSTPSGPIVVIDRLYPSDHRHGLVRIGDLQGRLLAMHPELALIGGKPEPLDADPRALLFIDLETTGLAGGAGTYAFLVGCAFFESAGFRVRQYFLPGYQHERPLLDSVAGLVQASAGLVSYNGKTFDVPVLETRYQFNRLTPPFADLAHVDMLHIARRFWRSVPAAAGAWPDTDSCRLGALERVLFGVRRVGDVPGFEIPRRYFDYMRSGDASPLEPVFEHNRLDLLSLALMTVRALRALADAPACCSSARESLAAGRLLERAGRAEVAERCYRDAAARGRLERGPDRASVICDALRALALRLRRDGRYEEAIEWWRRLAAEPSASPAARREALEALAIHYEHRATDLDQARRYARLSLSERVGTGGMEKGRYRLARIDRKLARRQPGADGAARLPQL